MKDKRRKYDIDIAREIFAEQGCKLLSNVYVRSQSKMDYVCACGSTAQITLEKFMAGQRCQQCKKEKMKQVASRQRHSYEYVVQVFKDGGCELLSTTYNNGKEKLHYRCNCGEEAQISFSKFKAGQRCSSCKPKRLGDVQRGKLSQNYNPNRSDEQRIKDRKYPEYIQWRRDVYERDDYTCQRCEERGLKINAHHIESYAKNPDKRTEITNGVTLCYDCHQEYHKAFGRNGANGEDFESFMYGEYAESLEPPNLSYEERDEYAYSSV